MFLHIHRYSVYYTDCNWHE